MGIFPVSPENHPILPNNGRISRRLFDKNKGAGCWVQGAGETPSPLKKPLDIFPLFLYAEFTFTHFSYSVLWAVSSVG
jgi:hypothetical protein